MHSGNSVQLNSTLRSALSFSDTYFHILPPTKEEVHVLPVFVCLFVCLSVCLLARLLKNASTDLDEMLRVDRCRDTDELINF